MATWVLEDDCLAPHATLRLDYTGPTPFTKVYPKLKPICRGIFEVETKDYWEKDFRWDNNSDPREFFVKIFVKRGIDAWTIAYAEIVIQGWEPVDPNKDGRLTITIGGKIRTGMAENTILQRTGLYKSIRWLYFKTFYRDTRRGYLKMCNNWLSLLKDKLQEALKIAPQVEEVRKGYWV